MGGGGRAAQTAREWRRRAEACVASGRYAEAADAFRREAAIYRANGDPEGAKVEEAKADRYSSTVRLFARVPGARPWTPPNLAKWEPEHGCYLGAFIDRDERLGRGFMSNSQWHRDPDAFARLTGRKLASTFCYLSWGRPFPAGWVQRLKAQGVAPHIAWEPNRGLDAVQDDHYLREWAEAASKSGVPIFLRFASEMNGDWTRYGGDPLKYKIKWALVRRVLERYAPNVAMVWCVAAIPERPIPRFYPGDAYVDWVGINLYSVPFFDNDPARPGLYQNPADVLRYVYKEYAARKPIAICEYGASHMSAVDRRDRPEWAARKIAEVYASLPRLYPRVRLIDIFNNNNLANAAKADRRLNNYSVTDSETVLRGYARAVASDYFLSDIAGWGQTPRYGARSVDAPLVRLDASDRAAKGTAVPRGILRVSSWARCWSDAFTVAYLLDGREAALAREHGTREAALSLTAPGPHTLTAVVRDERGREAARTQARLIVS